MVKVRKGSPGKSLSMGACYAVKRNGRISPTGEGLERRISRAISVKEIIRILEANLCKEKEGRFGCLERIRNDQQNDRNRRFTQPSKVREETVRCMYGQEWINPKEQQLA